MPDEGLAPDHDAAEVPVGTVPLSLPMCGFAQSLWRKRVGGSTGVGLGSVQIRSGNNKAAEEELDNIGSGMRGVELGAHSSVVCL